MGQFRVGILTGGGDCPGLNAVIRSVAKSFILQCDAEVIGFEDGFRGLVERRARRLRYRDVSGILTQGGTILGTSNKANPFRYYLRNDQDVSDEVLEYVKELKLDSIVAIGGDGTMSIANGLADLGIPIVGVPKTIDNDIVGTERTFGFDTAVAIATDAIDRLHTTAQSHSRIMILETMGRYAGWIALHSGVASGADVILIPEFEYCVEEVARICREREQGGQKFTLIVIAEGAKPVGGEMKVRQIDESSPDPIRLGGIANVLAAQLQDHVRSEIRATVLGHVQRGGTPTAFDRVLATAFGHHAMQLSSSRRSGVMVALQKNSMTEIALAEVADKTRAVPISAPALSAARAVGTSFGTDQIPGPNLACAIG